MSAVRTELKMMLHFPMKLTGAERRPGWLCNIPITYNKSSKVRLDRTLGCVSASSDGEFRISAADALC